MDQITDSNEMSFQKLQNLVAKTTKVGFSRVLLATVIYLLLTPFIVHKLGKEMFGLWSLNSIISTFVMMSDFGFKNSTVHFTAINSEDQEKVNDIFNTTFAFFLITSSVCIFVILCLHRIIIENMLAVPRHLYREAFFVIISTAVGFCFRLLSSPYQGIIEGNQRVYYTQQVFLFWMIFNAAATIIGLSFSPTIYMICCISVAGNILIWIMFFIDVRARYPYVKMNAHGFRMSTFKSILPYSIWIQIASLLILAREPILKILISRKYGLESLGAFEIAYRVTIQCMSFAVVPILTTLPVASKLRGQRMELMTMVRKYTKWVFLTLSIPSIVLVLFSRSIIRLWLGEGYETAARILPIIFIGFSIYYLSEPIYKTIQGIGKSQMSTLIQIIYLTSILVLLFYFQRFLGIEGVPLAILISSILFSSLNVFFFKIIQKRGF